PDRAPPRPPRRRFRASPRSPPAGRRAPALPAARTPPSVLASGKLTPDRPPRPTTSLRSLHAALAPAAPLAPRLHPRPGGGTGAPLPARHGGRRGERARFLGQPGVGRLDAHHHRLRHRPPLAQPGHGGLCHGGAVPRPAADLPHLPDLPDPVPGGALRG